MSFFMFITLLCYLLGAGRYAALLLQRSAIKAHPSSYSNARTYTFYTVTRVFAILNFGILPKFLAILSVLDLGGAYVHEIMSLEHFPRKP